MLVVHVCSIIPGTWYVLKKSRILRTRTAAILPFEAVSMQGAPEGCFETSYSLEVPCSINDLTMFFVTSKSASSALIKASATDDRRECTCAESTASSAPFASDSLNVDKKGRRDSSPETSSCEKPTRLVCLACASRSAGPARSNPGYDFAEVSDHVLDIGQAPSSQNSFPTRASPP